MSHIHILPEHLRNKIAAGEVIERPASVVKELVENAIDAEASRIKIEIEDGGKKNIIITDNGKGMSKEDATLSIIRHATSKLSSAEDLFDINTLGFRGEALASIASVSHFTLQTKEKNALSGTSFTISGGSDPLISEIGGSEGTKITINDLFYCIPVRKKFLKKDTTESRYIARTLEEIALTHPHIGFEYLSNTRKNIDLPHLQSKEDRVRGILGNTFFEQLIPILSKSSDIQIEGFVSPSGQGSSTREKQWIFVNNRCISDRTISAAIRDAYRSLLPHGQHPQFIIFITISPHLVDVNVHPRKSEVRFLRGNEIFTEVKNTIETVLAKDKKITPNWTLRSPTPSQSQTQSALSFTKQILQPMSQQSFPPSSLPKQSSHHFPISPSFDSQNNTPSLVSFSSDTSNNTNKNKEKGYRIIGQLRESFLLLETEKSLIIIDQHALHERIRYNEFMQQLESSDTDTQKLLLPEMIEISPQEQLLLEEHEELFLSLGFEWSFFGTNTLQVSAVPVGTQTEDISTLFHDILGEISSEGNSDTRLHAAKEKALTYLSCRGAVKFGDPLHTEEIAHLLDQWHQTGKGGTCPHGRPVSWEIPFTEIEKQVNR